MVLSVSISGCWETIPHCYILKFLTNFLVTCTIQNTLLTMVFLTYTSSPRESPKSAIFATRFSPTSTFLAARSLWINWESIINKYIYKMVLLIDDNIYRTLLWDHYRLEKVQCQCYRTLPLCKRARQICSLLRVEFRMFTFSSMYMYMCIVVICLPVCH